MADRLVIGCGYLGQRIAAKWQGAGALRLGDDPASHSGRGVSSPGVATRVV